MHADADWLLLGPVSAAGRRQPGSLLGAAQHPLPGRQRLVHACYNFLLFSLMMLGTGGFRIWTRM